jgi:hypothetical protein
MDVLELKENLWIPRKQEEGPKTIAEIRREVSKEILENKPKQRLKEGVLLHDGIIKQRQMGYPSQKRDLGQKNKSRLAVDDESWQTCHGKKGLYNGQDPSSYCPAPRTTKESQRRDIGPSNRLSKRAGSALVAVQTVGGRYAALLDDEDTSMSS